MTDCRKDNRTQFTKVFIISQFSTFIRIGQETAFNQHGRTVTMSKEIDAAVCRLDVAVIIRLQVGFDLLLYRFGQYDAVLVVGRVVNLKATILRLGEGVHMNADQYSFRCSLDEF